MNKRILSMVLVLCTLIASVPLLALPAVAATKKITFTFVNTATGAKESQTFETGSVVTIAEPSAAVNTDDVLGFYTISTEGKFTDWHAYNNCFANMGATFYSINKSNTFQKGKAYIVYDADTKAYDGWSGGFTVGAWYPKYTKGSLVVPYSVVGSDNTIFTEGLWGGTATGGLYAVRGRMITRPAGAATIAWTAIADGTVDIDFSKLEIPASADGAAYSDLAMVIAVNGVVVWPKKSAGKSASLSGLNSGFTGETFEKTIQLNGVDTKVTTKFVDASKSDWFYKELSGQVTRNGTTVTDVTPNTGSVLEAYKAYCKENGSPKDIALKAGDQVQIIFGSMNTMHVAAVPTVTYTKVDTTKMWSEIQTKAEYQYRTSFSSGQNYPTLDGSDTAGSKLVFQGNWDVLTYRKGLNHTAGELIDTLCEAHIASTENRGGSIWDGSGVGAMFAIGGHNEWGGAGSLISTATYDVAIRYTAEHTGLINVVFDSLVARNTDAMVSIFVNGRMVWPTENGSYSDDKDWYTIAEKYRNADASATIMASDSASLLKNIFVNVGDEIEMLYRIPTTGKFWENYDGGNHAGCSPKLSIDYTQMFPNMSMRASVIVGDQMDLVLTCPNTSDVTDLVVEINGAQVTLDAKGAYTFKNISLYDLQKEVTYKVIGRLAALGGEEGTKLRVLSEGKITAASAMLDAMGEDATYDKMVQTLLNMVGTAQRHLGKAKGTATANYLLSEDLRATAPEAMTLKNVYAVSGDNTHIQHASILLRGTDLGLKFTVAPVSGASTYKLEVADNADFTGATSIDMVETQGKDAYKAIVPVAFSEMDKTIYVRVVVDGTAGDVLTYSVETCIDRMIQEIVVDDGAYYTLRWVAAYGRALSACMNSEA